MIIAVTGTPGTGKTTLAKRLAKDTGYMYIDIKSFIEKHVPHTFDNEDACMDVHVDDLQDALAEYLTGDVILDGHLSHYMPSIDLCIVTTCDISVLKSRLTSRGYPEKKIRDNLDSEIFEILLTEAREAGHIIWTIDTTDSGKYEKRYEEIKSYIDKG